MSEFEHFYVAPGSSQPYNGTANTTEDSTTEVQYYQAILGFLVALLIYFCMLCQTWYEHGEATRGEIDNSIVRKKVLQHGQSQYFTSDTNVQTCKEDKRQTFRGGFCSRCSCKRQKQTVDESVKEDLSHRLRRHEKHVHQKPRQEATEIMEKREKDTHGDELILAEEGTSIFDLVEIVCPICLEAFSVGEDVAWSRLENCRHVFHYECIMPWAMLGNLLCPCCKQIFWSRNGHSSKTTMCIKALQTLFRLARFKRKAIDVESIMEKSRFCVIHGLISPSEESNIETL
mmetsp:Transcript_2108/g.4690  ORF Transcript_2108/g.4690 Transcript_2108/m.4690 type:complete len:287 (-) Transcript_2108:31-891(-)